MTDCQYQRSRRRGTCAVRQTTPFRRGPRKHRCEGGGHVVVAYAPLSSQSLITQCSSTDVFEYQDPDTSVRTQSLLQRSPLCLNINAATISSICRYYPCPRPAFTPYPTHSPTPPASSASVPLAQLLAPRRRQRPGPLPARRPGCTRLQTEPPWGQEPLHRIINGLAPPVKRYVLKYSSALASGSE